MKQSKSNKSRNARSHGLLPHLIVVSRSDLGRLIGDFQKRVDDGERELDELHNNTSDEINEQIKEIKTKYQLAGAHMHEFIRLIQINCGLRGTVQGLSILAEGFDNMIREQIRDEFSKNKKEGENLINQALSSSEN